ncbi:MAG: TonB-dependent receptor [Gammaproteobacteria bacterium]
MFTRSTIQTRSALIFIGLFSLTSLVPIYGYGQVLEEIIVTARKREENLQDIGISVTPITRATLEQQSINSIRELAKQVPGLTFQESFGRRDDRPGIRGQTSIGTIDFGVESGTSIFVDGVYVNADTSAFGLHDLERVEVVRGPQSALYGRNAYAGSINFVTAPPPDETEIRVKARYGSYDEGEGSFSISGSLTDNLAATLYARYYTYNGQFTNTYDDSDDVGDEETQSIAGTFFYNFGENISIRTRVAYSKDDDGHIPFTMVAPNDDRSGNGFDANGVDDYYVGKLPAPKDLPTNDFQPTHKDTSVTLTAARVGEDLVGPLNEDLLLQSGMKRETFIITTRADLTNDAGYQMSLLLGYHNEDRQTGSDSASLGVVDSGLSMFPYSDRDLEDFSLELRLDSPQDSRLRYGGGFFYYKDELVENQYSYDGAGTIASQLNRIEMPPGTTATNGGQGRPVTVATSLDDTALYLGVTRRETRNLAAYGSISFDILDNLTPTVEFRYAKDKKEIVGAERDGTDPFTDNLFPASRTFSEISARFLLEYKVNDDLLLYGSYSRGNKPGGFNGNSNRDPQPIFGVFNPVPGSHGGQQLASFEEETGETIEFGLKSSWLNNRVNLNASGYFNNVEDAQLTQTYAWCTGSAFACFSTGEFIAGANIINIPEVDIYGFEIEASAAVTDNLDVSFGYAYVDSEIKEGTSRDHGRLFGTFNTAAGNDPVLSSVAGNKFPRISPHQFNFAANYIQPVAWGEAFLNLNGAYEDERFVQVSNLAIIPDSFVMNFRGGIRYQNYEMAVWGKNILDEDSPVDALRFRDGDFVRAFQITNRRGAAFGVDFSAQF